MSVRSRRRRWRERRGAVPARRRGGRSARRGRPNVGSPRPRTSRYRRPSAVSGCTPRPTSFVTTTTGSSVAAERWAAVSARSTISSSAQPSPIRFDTHSVRQSMTVNVPAALTIAASRSIGASIVTHPSGRSARWRAMRPAMSASWSGESGRCRGAVAMNVTGLPLRSASSTARVLLPLRAPPVRNVRGMRGAQ